MLGLIFKSIIKYSARGSVGIIFLNGTEQFGLDHVPLIIAHGEFTLAAEPCDLGKNNSGPNNTRLGILACAQWSAAAIISLRVRRLCRRLVVVPVHLAASALPLERNDGSDVRDLLLLITHCMHCYGITHHKLRDLAKLKNWSFSTHTRV